ncbi:hypothetical protein BDR04DRAFT_1018708, partial [Suillus decipiens]
ACEEITYLNVKVWHLCTAINDEKLRMSEAMQKLLISNLQLACELQHQYHLCTAINAMHCY